jgi:hypothetical protein
MNGEQEQSTRTYELELLSYSEIQVESIEKIGRRRFNADMAFETPEQKQ